VCLLGLLAATSSKMGREVYTLMKQEFGEVEEPVPPGTVGSSTMPQKRNPKLSQDVVAAAAQVRALVPLALEAMQTEHEADFCAPAVTSARAGEGRITASRAN
jgi:adenylosuccinate lyase